jgi:hypothetical protein
MTIFELLVDLERQAVVEVVLKSYCVWILNQLPPDAKVLTLAEISSLHRPVKSREYFRADTDKYISSEYARNQMIEFGRRMGKGGQSWDTAAAGDIQAKPHPIGDVELGQRARQLAELMHGLSTSQAVESLDEALVQWSILNNEEGGTDSVFHLLYAATEF